MDETFQKLFDCPDYLQGKYCHALCNYRHQTDAEKRSSKLLIIYFSSLFNRFLVLVEQYRESLTLKLNPKISNRFGPVCKH
jgi:hypothetical protein